MIMALGLAKVKISAEVSIRIRVEVRVRVKVRVRLELEIMVEVRVKAKVKVMVEVRVKVEVRAKVRAVVRVKIKVKVGVKVAVKVRAGLSFHSTTARRLHASSLESLTGYRLMRNSPRQRDSLYWSNICEYESRVDFTYYMGATSDDEIEGSFESFSPQRYIQTAHFNNRYMKFGRSTVI